MTTVYTFIPDEKAFAKAYAEFLKSQEWHQARKQREADTISGDLARDER